MNLSRRQSSKLRRIWPHTFNVPILLLFLLALLGSIHASDEDVTISDLSPYEILLRLYDSTRGLRWKNRTGWLQSEDVCSWNGITCFQGDDEKTGKISEIDLSGNHLVGTLPFEIFTLPWLYSLTLDDNPDLNIDLNDGLNGSQIELMSLVNSRVRALDAIGDAVNLQFLNLERSQITGGFPDDILYLTRLTSLFLDSNSLSGTLPSFLSVMTKLEELSISNNQLEGTLPSELGLLTNLQILELSDNAFTGTLPSEFNDCSSLQRLVIDSQPKNNLGGLVGPLPPLDQLSNIVELSLHGNHFNGSIPANFLAAAAAARDDVVRLDLSNNDLTGSIPTSWSAFTRLRPLLQDNRIDNFPDELCNAIVDSANNDNSSLWSLFDTGPCPDMVLCPPGTYTTAGRATATESCQPCDSAFYYGSTICLVVQSGGDGSNATTPETERDILELLYRRSGGHDWRKAEGWLQDDDICTWYGITCNDDGKVQGIAMKNNGLSRTFPSEIFSLPSLEVLNLNSNAVRFSFEGIAKATNLLSLDLTNSGLDSLDFVEELDSTGIETLRLGANSLTGEIPSSLFQLRNLEELNLSYNLFSGSLELETARLESIQRFMAYGNILEGPLPTELGLLTKANVLDLSENAFTGTLPTELEKLTALKSLSIHQTSSDAGLSGPLPPFEDLTQLTSLRLEANHLTGALPPNFLANTERGESRVEVRLSDNEIEGVVPTEWADRFADLFIDLTGNKIVGLQESWCAQQDWMDDEVGEFDCDAILCPSGTYNPYGRQQSSDSECMDCPKGGNVMGARECDSSGDSDGQQALSMAALKELYYATGGASWTNNSGWDQMSDYCSGWFGIVCDANGQIISIDLSENGLSGRLPRSIFKTPSLNVLNFAGNQDLACTFDGLDQASNLKILLFDDVRLESTNGISKGTSLSEVHLSNNDLTGTFPSELLELTLLTYLSLDFNKLSGRIPIDISRLSKLELLRLDGNRMSGQIPAAIGSLKQMRVISLEDNHLTGTLPDELNDLLMLETLNIQRETSILDDSPPTDDDSPERIGGGIHGPLLSLHVATSLRSVFLSGNSLSGSIPFNFLDSVADKTQPVFVNIEDNQLTGTIPASLAQFSRMNFYAAGNKITEIAPGLCKKERWMNGLVKKFGCSAILCPPRTFNDYGMFLADPSTEFPCAECAEEGAATYFGSKSCLTSAEVVTSDERERLKELFTALDGFHWKDTTNWLDDSASICSWFGVTCVTDVQENVETLHLSANGLVGSVPASVFQFKFMKEIDLSNNQVKIDFTDSEEATGITVINLDNTGVESLPGIVDAAPELELLHITGNAFTSFPEELFELTFLEALYISNNDFSGPFPPSLSLLSNLFYLDCVDCGFQGTLPTAIGLLTKLVRLSLSENRLSGTIPTEILFLTNLQLLDLSSQNSVAGKGLSGTLPDFAGMLGIVEVYMSGNSLNGSIPSTFLSDVKSTESITMDFRSNLLTGMIPSELSRFPYARFFLSNNMINGIPQAVCRNSWNSGPASQSDCDHILCAKGSYNTLGYATTTEPCVPCSDARSLDYFGSVQCGENIEKEILSKVYSDLNGDGWISDDGWLDDPDVCKWYGITCYSQGLNSGRVQGILLAGNNLVGTLSSNIYNLQYLVSLDLRRNTVWLPLNGIENATNLKSLYLSETPVKSLTGIGASKLELLHLTSCNITGPIPTELFDVRSLQGLYLNYNSFDGTLPAAIQQLSALREFYLFHNKVSGQFPSEIGLLSNLVVVGVGGNRFTGTLPTQINQLNMLETLSFQEEDGMSVSQNIQPDAGFDVGLSGSLPGFDGLISLKELYLGKNSIEGLIPENFLSGISDTSQTIKVDLTGNKLSGSIPSALARFKDLRLFLSGNMIENVPDDICNKVDWMDGLMTGGCDALLCKPGSYNAIGRRTRDISCQACAFNASTFYYGSQTCLPQDGDDLDERSILFQIYRTLDGNKWIHRDNWLEDDRSICSWYGVHCATGTNDAGSETVVRLELPSNGLKGTIPSVVYHLSSLKVLDVRGNEIELDFHGADATKTVEELYLESTRVSSVVGIGKIKPLKVLHLAQNDFRGGSLPDDLFDLTNLEFLDVSKSGLGGILPESIGRLSRLVQFFCQGNDMTGTLPSDLGRLERLEVLDLSENMFVGNLPLEMASMKSIESIFIDAFSRNGAGISGPLPSFSTMPRLRNLYLGSNTLTGAIPADFLAGIDATDELINIGLSWNSLTGTVPSQLSRLTKVNIALTDNDIEEIDKALCSMNHWMDGAVKQFGCHAIMCPVGTFNENGRQTSKEDPCIPCPEYEAKDQMGSTSCLVVQRQQEKQILELFFQATGGNEWKEKEGWMDDNIDVCKWHGIACTDDSTVESILLGSNNLSGRPPKDLFDMKSLQFLWLYSNPIDFSFEGIERARKLTSLLLDSTGLKSISGIGLAPSLSDIDIRFNGLTGPLPSEISNLRELESFSAGFNKFIGTVPTFSNSKQLKSLRIGNNLLTGALPDFANHRFLSSLDLSDNQLVGTIPGNLLGSLESGSKTVVDLSSNQLSGVVPGEISRHHAALEIYLSDNKLIGIDSALCSAVSYNDGDVGEYGCDAILCPAGFYLEGTGRASKEKGPCIPCPQSQYYGSSTCGVVSSALSTSAGSFAIILSASLVAALSM
ncbi:hypothetical protein MHU86_1629 [Fragilaria crotonensis]|nr:hypothetical protein MHU86_1629 [Fragilaria crotonensis]